MKQLLKILPTPHKPNFRTSTAWLIGGLTFWTSLAYYSPTAKAQTPFTCDGTFFLSQGNPTTLNTVNTGSVPFSLSPVLSGQPRNNATGFRFDNQSFIYGIDPDTPGSSATGHIVYQVDQVGNTQALGTSITATASGDAQNIRYIAGDIGINGNYYVYGQDGTRGVLLEIDVSGATATLVKETRLDSARRIADIALNPLDGKLYGYDKGAQQVVFFDPDDGLNISTPITPDILPIAGGDFALLNSLPQNVGATFFDGAGNLFLYHNSGEFFQVKVGVGSTTGNREIVNLSAAEQVNDNDGSACPFAPKLEKSISATQVVAGGNITYTYIITNPNPIVRAPFFSGLTFSDNLTNGRTYVGTPTIQLEGIGGSPGTVTLSNNNQNLTISGLDLPSTDPTIPSAGIVTITAVVNVSATAASGTVFNQANLDGLTGAFPPNIPSDFPGEGALPDSSPLVILPPPVPAGTKSVNLAIDADNTSSVTPGDTIEYTVNYFNTSTTINVTDFAVTDTIDSNLTFVPGSYSFQVVSGAPAVGQNTAFDGTTDNRLTLPGGTLTPGSQISITYRATVNGGVQPGTAIENQAMATSAGGSGIVTPSLTDAVGGSADIPQILDDGQDTGNAPGNTGDDEPTRLVVADPTATGNLVLVKRITNVLRNGTTLPGVVFDDFVDDPADINDNLPGWSALSPIGVLSLGADNALTSGDIVEYTVYFLSNGREPVANLNICDAIPARTDYVTNSLFFSPNTATGTFFNELDSTLPVPPCPDSNNPDGAVSLDLSPSFSNTNPDNVGFVRFRVQIN